MPWNFYLDSGLLSWALEFFKGLYAIQSDSMVTTHCEAIKVLQSYNDFLLNHVPSSSFSNAFNHSYYVAAQNVGLSNFRAQPQ